MLLLSHSMTLLSCLGPSSHDPKFQASPTLDWAQSAVEASPLSSTERHSGAYLERWKRKEQDRERPKVLRRMVGLTLHGTQAVLKQLPDCWEHSWLARVWVVAGYWTTYVQLLAVLFGARMI